MSRSTPSSAPPPGASVEVLGKASSINVAKVMWTCLELGVDAIRRDWGPGFDSPPAEIVALNPNAMVPVLRDGSLTLWESNAIIRYLANVYATGALYPRDARARAPVDQWIDWQASELNAAWRYVFQARVRRTPGFDDPVEIRRSTSRWIELMHILDTQLLKTGAYVAGSDFSLADIPIGLSVLRWDAVALDVQPLPGVAAYRRRLDLRQGFTMHGRQAMR